MGSPRQDDQAGALYLFEPPVSEVILGLGHQTVAAGSTSELLITIDNRNADVAAFQFSTRLPPEVPLDDRGSGLFDVECDLEDEFREDFELHSFMDVESGTLSVELSSTVSPPKPLPRDGRLGRCRVSIGDEAMEGVWSIPCIDSGWATDIDGTGFATRCETGELTVSICSADCNGDRIVSVDELVTALQIGLLRYPRSTCAVSDVDRDGSVSVDKIVSAVGYAIEGCPHVP